MRWTQTVPTKPGYYVECARFSNGQEQYRLLLIHEDHKTKNIKVDISHFGKGYPRGFGVDTQYIADHLEEIKEAGVLDQLYTKTEGQYSMYVDAVNMSMAASSYSGTTVELDKNQITDCIRDYFVQCNTNVVNSGRV